MNISQLHTLFLASNSVCTDTRKIKKDDLYFALKGEHFNGNVFAQSAIEKGASYAVIDESEHLEELNDRFILVENVLETLQHLARYHRRYLDLKVIALTGSNGKTTTKELIHSVLHKKYNTFATIGNLNNHIGVPLTLLSMDASTEIGIVEMGANHLKEIELLCSIAQPNYGYITNFGKAHLEGFGSLEGVIKGKSELYDFIKSTRGTIFSNAQDDTQMSVIGNYEKVIVFGSSKQDDIYIEYLSSNPFVNVNYKNKLIQSQLIGAYNFNNISAAIAIGEFFNIDESDIKNAIEGYIPENNRSQIIEKNGNRIILDAYNANPTSMKAALENFSNLKEGLKLVILGDMFELGKTSKEEHQHIADYASTLNIDSIFLVGKHFYDVNTTNATKFETFNDLENALTKMTLKDYSILIKGSRGMALERALELI